MSHDNHVTSGFNRDVPLTYSIEQARDFYMHMVRDWKDPYGIPKVEVHDNVWVVRDDYIVGTKARAADALVSTVRSDTLVYVQPRAGLAGVSLIEVARRHGKRVVLFMPASQRISAHQAVCIERGAEPIFVRVAAMPNLNKIAEKWAAENNAYFVPLGLKHPLATAGLIKAALSVFENEQPRIDDTVVWTATSTGVLTRALQIAWPDVKFMSICVARNMKEGELGRSAPLSYPKPFLTEAPMSERPPFPSVANYDAKVWIFIPKIARNGFWNVGKDPVLEDEGVYDLVNSNVDWVRK